MRDLGSLKKRTDEADDASGKERTEEEAYGNRF